MTATDVYAHPEYRAFLARIIASPTDDLPRLVYADWLDEHGEAERAEFIRVQCELEKVGRVNPKHGVDFTTGRYTKPAKLETSQALQERERELWRHIDRYGLLEAVPRLGNWSAALNAYHFRTMAGNVVHVRRGFVDEVRCTLADWCGGECDECRRTGREGPRLNWGCHACGNTGQRSGIGPAVVAAHPVQTVLTDREPHENADGSWSWWIASDGDTPDPAALPKVLWRHLPMKAVYGPSRFATRQLALDALSAALILWARP